MSELNTPEIAQSHDVISVGSVVELHFLEDPEGETVTVQVVSPDDRGNTGAAEWAIPTNEPLGEKLLNRRTGDTVSFENRRRETIQAEIISVRNP